MKTLLRHLTFIIASLILLTSCNNDNGTQTVKVDNKYSIELPKYLEKVSDLKPEASLQYQNLMKEFYVIVIDEPKSALATALEQNSLYDSYEDNLNGYSRLITDGMDPNLKIKELPAFKDTLINGNKARLLSFEGISEGYRIYWKLAFIEGNNRYYQIMAWTIAQNKDKYEKEMTAMINSFKETDKSKKR